jgi:hypothetical protein
MCFFADEAWFHLSAYLNSQNSRFWSSENPRLFHEVPLRSQKIGCWCAISRKRIVGSIFFSETVTAEKCQVIIMQFISLLNEEERFCWLQQDGATSHNANSTAEMLKQFFDDRIISNNLWPLRSPRLTPPDYFLWGYLKQVVYSNRPQTIEELKQYIEVTILKISQETSKKIARNIVTRVNTCYAENCCYFQHLL